ncbi:MAG: class I SAM-dependent methyltransferase [Paludibacter sp.]|nr:class I SAM-dependent methyltransferase [Paludibacter sp.]
MENLLACKICGNTINNNPFLAKELMYGLNREFNYFECSKCGCLQIESIPTNIADYYPTDYLSFKRPIFFKKRTAFKSFLKIKVARYYAGSFNILGFILSFFVANQFPWIKPGIVNLESKILDVGCGTGKLLLTMQRFGYKNLTGIDPFNQKDIFYDNNLSIYKKDLFDLDNKFDLIMLNHSFEHMEFPEKVLLKLSTIVEKNGCILIRIPLAGSYAWRKYKTNWVQLDAPRHFYLHTVKSMSILAEKSGLKLDEVKFDSTSFQFIGSEKYLRGYKITDKVNIFSKIQLKAFKKEAIQLNSLNDGDTACFYLYKETSNS